MDRQLKHNLLFLEGYKGITLVELIVAATIVLMSSVAIYTVMGGGSSVSRNLVMEKKAYKAAQSVLERVEYSSGPDYLAVNTGTVNIDSIVLFGKGGTGDEIKAGRKVQVSAVSFTFEGVVIPGKKITSIVAWNDRNVDKQVELSNIITYFQQ